jgi:hypothetical protein
MAKTSVEAWRVEPPEEGTVDLMYWVWVKRSSSGGVCMWWLAKSE